MRRLTRPTVVAAGFRRALSQLDPAVRLPSLERLAARGDHARALVRESDFQALESWQLDILHALQLPQVPSAAASALGAGLARRVGTWLHAEFVHVAAGLDQLVLVPLRDEQALDEPSLEALRLELAKHVRADGYEWLAAGREQFLHTASSLRAQTCAPDAAGRMSLVEAMPRGSDGQALRRLMTELQMQLHEHAVNQRRERAGLLPANAVWLWGGGAQLRGVAPARMRPAFANDSFVRGVYRIHERECAPLPEDGAALLEAAADDVLVLLHCASLEELEQRWLAPLEGALHIGRIEELELILDDMHLTANRWNRWRLWRRVQPMAQVGR